MTTLVTSTPSAAALPGRFRVGRAGAWLALAIGLGLTLLAWQVTRAVEEREARRAFEAQAADIALRTERRLRTYEQVLRGAAGLLAAAGPVSRSEWTAYASALALDDRFPGIVGLGFAPYVPAPVREGFVQAARRDGAPEFNIVPAGERDGYGPILYLEPASTANRRAIGFDMFSEPLRRDAMLRARDTGKAAVSAPVQLVQDEAQARAERGFLMYFPVYANDAAGDRGRALLGWTYGAFRVRPLLDSIVPANAHGLAVRVYGAGRPGPDALLYERAAAAGAAAFAETRTLQLEGLQWTLEFAGVPLAREAGPPRSTLLLASGLLATLLIFLIAWTLATTRERALGIAAEMTEALNRANATLESKVAQRTADLARANAELLEESRGRARADTDRADALARMERQIEQLRALSGSALRVSRAPTVAEKLEAMAAEARRLTGAAAAVVRLAPEAGDAAPMRAEAYAPGSDAEEQARLRARLDERLAGTPSGASEPGVLAAALARRDGSRAGALAACAPAGTAFAEEDEVTFEQLALVAAAALETAEALDLERRARADAEAASRAKDDFISVVSHELRTPLNAIQGWVHLLRSREPGNATVAKAAEVIQRNLDAQVRLVDDLLDTARMASGRIRFEREPLDLAATLRDAVRAGDAASAARGVEVELALPAEPAAVVGDARRLEQAAAHLVANAVKFSPQGGTVEVGLARRGERWRVEVRDHGDGIPADFLPRVFERFGQADGSIRRRFGGLGLGLWLTRRIVEAHGGTVAVESAGEGQGSTFAFEIPCAAAVAAGAGAPARHDPGARDARLDGKRILVVDDHADARDFLQAALAGAGAEVTTAEDGLAALAALDAAGEALPDVVLCDLALPREDGFGVLARIRALPGPAARLPVVAVTAFATDEARTRAREAGFDGYVAKPVDVDRLVGKLVELAGR